METQGENNIEVLQNRMMEAFRSIERDMCRRRRSIRLKKDYKPDPMRSGIEAWLSLLEDAVRGNVRIVLHNTAAIPSLRDMLKNLQSIGIKIETAEEKAE